MQRGIEMEKNCAKNNCAMTALKRLKSTFQKKLILAFEVNSATFKIAIFWRILVHCERVNLAQGSDQFCHP